MASDSTSVSAFMRIGRLSPSSTARLTRQSTRVLATSRNVDNNGRFEQRGSSSFSSPVGRSKRNGDVLGNCPGSCERWRTSTTSSRSGRRTAASACGGSDSLRVTTSTSLLRRPWCHVPGPRRFTRQVVTGFRAWSSSTSAMPRFCRFVSSGDPQGGVREVRTNGGRDQWPCRCSAAGFLACLFSN